MRSGREEQSKNSLKRDKSNKANKKKNKAGYDSSESDTGTASELNTGRMVLGYNPIILPNTINNI